VPDDRQSLVAVHKRGCSSPILILIWRWGAYLRA
jgi:hypothetical protein